MTSAMRLSICLIVLSIISFSIVSAQEFSNDSIVQSKTEMDTTHSTKRAALLSALLPGAGQVYNHLAKPKGKKNAFWKVPIIYAGLGATAYFALENHRMQGLFKEEYTYRLQNTGTNLDGYEQYDAQGILTLYESSLRSRDLMIFAFIAVYGLNVLDAHVEAHFVNFDVSKDLSLQFRPVMHDFSTPGISLSLNFR